MIILTATTDNLQLVLAGAITTNQLDIYTSWRDITTTGFTPGRTPSNSNNTTDVNIVPAPAASTQRVIDFISIYNRDTVNATVTVKLDANGTEYTLVQVILAPNERMAFVEGEGWRVIANNGAVKQTYSSGTNASSSVIQNTVLGSDVTNAEAVANTITDVTGLNFAVTSGNMYWFRFVIPYTAAAATTGSRWSISGPGSPTYLSYKSVYTLSTTADTTNNATAYDIPAASNASSIAAGNTAIIEGYIRPSSNGTVVARFASEITVSAITAKAGAIVFFQQTA